MYAPWKEEAVVLLRLSVTYNAMTIKAEKYVSYHYVWKCFDLGIKYTKNCGSLTPRP